MWFRNCRFQKTWLGKCLKSLDSGDLLTGDIVNENKHS